MDKLTYEQLIEGEALYFDRPIDAYQSFSAFLETIESSNQLFHVAAYHWARRLLEEGGVGLAVVDAACGTGYGSEYLAGASNVAKVIGIDLNPAQIEYARAHFRKPEFRVGNLCGDLPFVAERGIDAAVSFQTIEHVLDAPAFMRAFWRMLKPQGFMLLGSPTHARPLPLPPNNPYHLFEYNDRLLVELASFFFAEVRLFEDLPRREAFDVLFQRIPGLGVPRANYLHLSRPRLGIAPEAYAEFRAGFLIKVYQELIGSLQARLITEKRADSFLSSCWPHIDFVEGFHQPERRHIWTKAEAVLGVSARAGLQSLEISLTPCPAALRRHGRVGAEIINQGSGESLTHVFTTREPLRYKVVPGGRDVLIRIKCDALYSPAEDGQTDLRRLGLCLHDFKPLLQTAEPSPSRSC